MIVRFGEFTRYDITQDCEVVCFTGVTDGGSFHTEIPLRGSRHLRESRAKFKDVVIDHMQAGREPCEVSLA